MTHLARRCAIGAGFLSALFWTVSASTADQQSFDLVERGRYLSVPADCAGCHTRPGGKPYAGGVALATPFGTLVGSNITPDRDAGIGAWTDDEFVAALHEGRGRGGTRLFPAMPYPAYTKMTRQDALAIRAYLMTVEPVSEKVESNQLPFPLGIRFNMMFWNGLNFSAGPFEPDPSKSAEWNRGHYLVDALGHCGTCHTPKNVLGADKGSGYLQGGLLQGWFAPNITANNRKGIGSWSVQDIADYLKTGANAYAIASGPMGEEVVNGSSKMTDDDLKAIAVYLKSVEAGPDNPPTPIPASDSRMIAGQAIYKDNCAPCHTDAGSGSARLFSSLARSHAIQSDDPTSLIRAVLDGRQGVHTAGAPTSPAMPSFGWRLSDAQVASVLTYVRNSWGNSASAVSAGRVAKLRNGSD
jgi:mono/diheme cytochrome c family protein